LIEARDRVIKEGKLGKIAYVEICCYWHMRARENPPDTAPPEYLDYEMWLGPAPFAPYTRDRVHFNFRWIWDYSGGIICDWGAHLFDTAQWANDTERSGPVEIEAAGTFWSGGLYNTVKDYDVTYRYANGVVMTARPGTRASSSSAPKGFPPKRARMSLRDGRSSRPSISDQKSP
jgi:predicted dehydrogenase